jgi:tetratricopeptide (TPR) repeat protein
MIAYFQTFAADQNEDYAKLELEWENLSASIEQAQQRTLWPAVLELTKTLQPAWFRRGRYHEARRAFPLAVAAAEALDDPLALAHCLYHWGYICWEQNDWDEAEEKLTVSLDLFTELGDQAGIAKVQLQLGVLDKDRANYAEAEQHLAASKQIREALDDQQGIAETIYEQAHLQYSCGNYEISKQLFEKALSLQETLNDQLGVLRTLRSLSVVLGILTPNDLDLKKQHVQRAFDLSVKLQDEVEIGIIYRLMFWLFLQDEQYQRAEKYAIKSLESFRKLGDRRGLAMSYYELCEFYRRQGLNDEALKYGQNSLRICLALEDIPGTAFSLQRLGDIYKALNQPEQACRSWREALELARKLTHKNLVQKLTKQLQDC